VPTNTWRAIRNPTSFCAIGGSSLRKAREGYRRWRFVAT
jgi:hypothetical protein